MALELRGHILSQCIMLSDAGIGGEGWDRTNFTCADEYTFGFTSSLIGCSSIHKLLIMVTIHILQDATGFTTVVHAWMRAHYPFVLPPHKALLITGIEPDLSSQMEPSAAGIEPAIISVEKCNRYTLQANLFEGRG